MDGVPVEAELLVFWKEKLVLFAVPKTGTTALEGALGPVADIAILNPPGLKHCSVRRYLRHLAPFVERHATAPMERVAVMREPVDWLESWYRYRTRPALRGQANSTGGIDFEAFVTAYLAPEPPAFAKVGSQARFLEGGVDRLFRHDRIADLVRFLETRLNRAIELPSANVSPRRDVRLSPRLEQRLREERPADFALWQRLHEGR